MKRDDSSPEAYIASIDEPQKSLFLAIRELIVEVAPDAEEGIEYGMLVFGDIANLAAQKNYVSLYIPPAAMAPFKQRHPSLNCGKCCLRFSSAAKFEALGRDEIRNLIKAVVALPPDQRGC
ncbi:MAG: DUF1801 domain-containing protein [Verrucomicrobiales bacterium]|nr:DUF1801 domain-containing protein [Verrucomicrobiales bacterium]